MLIFLIFKCDAWQLIHRILIKYFGDYKNDLRIISHFQKLKKGILLE